MHPGERGGRGWARAAGDRVVPTGREVTSSSISDAETVPTYRTKASLQKNILNLIKNSVIVAVAHSSRCLI